MQGKLITLEGIDGSGKSTVAKRLSENPKILAHAPVFTREPTRNTLTGRAVEEAIGSDTDQLAELFLFTADHAEHIAKLVRPSLESGRPVISDRYSDSRYAYQGMTLKGRLEEPLAWVKGIHRGWTIVPDLTILFEISPETAVKRCGNRGDKTKFEKIEFLRGVREIFHTLAAEEAERFVLIEADRPAEEIEAEVVEKILAVIEG